MVEMSRSCEIEGDFVFVRGFDDLFVANRAAGLNHRRDSRARGAVDAVAKRKEGFRRANRAVHVDFELVCLAQRGERGIDTACHAHSNRHHRPVFDIDDAIRLRERRDFVGNREVFELAFARGACALALHVRDFCLAHAVCLLEQKAALDVLEVDRIMRNLQCVRVCRKELDALFCREDVLRLWRDLRGDDDLEIVFVHEPRERFIEDSINRRNAAIGRDGVAGERGFVRFCQCVAQRESAGVAMLDNRHSRARAKVCRDFQRLVEVGIVVEAWRALERGDVAPKRARLVECAALVRVFAIACRADFVRGDEVCRAKVVVDSHVHVVGNHRVIRSCVLEGFLHKSAPKVERVAAVLERVKRCRVIVWACQHNHIGEVLRRRANERRSPDVDVFDNRVPIVRALHGRGKRVEIDANKVDGLDSVFLRHLCVLFAAKENPAVDFGVQCLDAPAKELAAARVIANICRRNFRLAQRRERPTCRENLIPKRAKLLCKRNDSAFVAHAKQGFHRPILFSLHDTRSWLIVLRLRVLVANFRAICYESALVRGFFRDCLARRLWHRAARGLSRLFARAQRRFVRDSWACL